MQQNLARLSSLCALMSSLVAPAAVTAADANTNALSVPVSPLVHATIGGTNQTASALTNFAALRARWSEKEQGGPFIALPNSALYREYWGYRTNLHQIAPKTNTLTILEPPPHKVAFDFAATAEVYANSILSILTKIDGVVREPELRQKLKDVTLEGGAEVMMLHLIGSPKFKAVLSEILKKPVESFTCKEYSTIFVACFIELSRHTTSGPYTISLQAGLIFHKQAPYGYGHQWVAVGDVLYDPSVPHEGHVTRAQVNDARYLTIAGARIFIDPRKRIVESCGVAFYLDPRH
jgi:hypothetical protein